jgi:hypothetical protein
MAAGKRAPSPRPTRFAYLLSLLVGLTLAAGAVLAQVPPEAPTARDSRMPSFAGRPLAEALQELDRQGLDILFTSLMVTPEMRVVEEPQGDSPREILDSLLAPFDLEAQAGPRRTLVVVARAHFSEVRGEVREVKTGIPLPGVQVLLTHTPFETYTAKDGRFQLTSVPPGTYVVEARRPGFVVEQSQAIEVLRQRPAEISFALIRAPLAVDEVVVTPGQISLVRTEPVAAVALEKAEILALPHLGDDLFRTLTLFPGITGTELSARFQIRGGRGDEVLVRLDNLELLEPYHLRDFSDAFSIIAPQAISQMDLLVGGFPAQFGDRMGGVLDMRTDSPHLPLRRHLGLGVLGAQIGAAGTWKDDGGAWLGVGRYGFPEIFLSYLNDKERPRFWDGFGKVERQLGESHSLALRLLHGGDRFEILKEEAGGREEADTGYGGTYLWLTHQALISPSLFVDSMVAGSRIERDRRGRDRDAEGQGFVVRDDRRLDAVSLRQDWNYQFSERSYWTWGLEARRMDGTYHYFNDRDLEDILAEIRSLPRSGSTAFDGSFRDDHLSLYTSHRRRWGRLLTTEVGLRYDRHDLTSDEDLSPRLNLVLAPDEANVFRVAWGHFFQSQRPYELAVEDGETTFLSSERTELVSVGYEHAFRRGTTVRLEAYRRDIRDPRPRYENIFEPITSFPEIEADRVLTVPSWSRAQGVELFLRGRRGPKLGWWINYAYARSRDRIAGRWRPRGFDQPQTLNLDLDLRPWEHWHFNLAFRFHTGWPTTKISGRLVPPEDDPDDDGEPGEEPGEDPGIGEEPKIVPVFGPIGGERLRNYHRLDLRVSREWKLTKSRLSLYFDVQNVYDKENIAGQDVELEFAVDPDDQVRLIPVAEKWGGFLPSVGIEWEF